MGCRKMVFENEGDKNDETVLKAVHHAADSSLISRNVTINGHRTSVRLEPEMWNALREISRLENMTIHQLCSIIHNRKKTNSSFTAALRVFLMMYYRTTAREWIQRKTEKKRRNLYESL